MQSGLPEFYSLQVRRLLLSHIGAPMGALPKCGPRQSKKKKRFSRHDDIKVLRDLRFSLNQPLKSADE
jgi:hypothetical protein